MGTIFLVYNRQSTSNCPFTIFFLLTNKRPLRLRCSLLRLASCVVATIFSSLAFLSSSVSMANLSHLVPASFSSLALLSSSVSTANLTCLLATTFSSLSFLSNSFSSPHFNLLRVARCCFSWFSVSYNLFFSSCIFLVILLSLSFSRPILSLSSICSSVSEALFALSFSFLSEHFFSGFFFIHAKAALAYIRRHLDGEPPLMYPNSTCIRNIIRVLQVGFNQRDEGRIKQNCL